MDKGGVYEVLLGMDGDEIAGGPRLYVGGAGAAFGGRCGRCGRCTGGDMVCVFPPYDGGGTFVRGGTLIEGGALIDLPPLLLLLLLPLYMGGWCGGARVFICGGGALLPLCGG